VKSVMLSVVPSGATMAVFATLIRNARALPHTSDISVQTFLKAQAISGALWIHV